MVDELSREEVVEAVSHIVKDLFLSANIAEPPIDAVVIARRHLQLPNKPQRRRKVVESYDEPPEELKHWEAALQIGDHFKPDLLRRLGLDPNQPRPMMGESLSKLVAAQLLLPLPWFAKDAQTAGFDLLTLKDIYRTASLERIAWRWLDLTEPCIVTIVDNDHVRRRRSNAWPTRRELHSKEQECQRYVNEYSRPCVVRGDGWTVQGWPVHRSDWKREVLRSIVEVDH